MRKDRARQIEIGAAVALLIVFVAAWGQILASASVAIAGVRGVISFFRLLGVDTWGVLATGGLVVLRLIFIVTPFVLWARRWPRRRFIWLPLIAVPFFLLLGVSVAAFSTTLMWILLATTSTLGCVAAWRRRFAWISLAPLVLCAEPILGHSPLADRTWPMSRLAARCAKNDGIRPQGFVLERSGARFYAVTRLDDTFALVTGERTSRWIRVLPEGGYAVAEPSKVRGNLWQGCLVGSTLVFAKNHRLIRVERAPDGWFEPEVVTETELVDRPFHPELDLVEPACDPVHERVFVSELVSGGIREISLRDESVRHHDLGGFNLQYLLRRDGKLVGIDTARLVVYDPDTRHIDEEHAAGLGVMGIDLCLADDAVAITDMTGRLRIFERDGGPYRLASARALTAPRRLSFSPDCRSIAVTSADDRTVWLLRRSDLAIVAEHHVGPGLRDVTFLTPHTFAVADACSATFFDAP